MKYSLRSLMIVVILAPPMLAGVYTFACWLFPGDVEVERSDPIQPVGLNSDQQIALTFCRKLNAEKKAGSLKSYNIEIDVQAGKVLLTGRTSSEEQRDRVLTIAASITGVTQVVSHLSVP